MNKNGEGHWLGSVYRINKKTQCAAMPNAAHCISRCSTLRWPMQRTAAFDR